ncbi:MAG: glycosyltransferase family 2 protein [Bacteroidia bacterium]|nr:glycosyltransferase family 2 protein [Bacteroidia bacterium]
MNDKRIEISVVAPLYNEAANLAQLYERLTHVLEGMGVDYEFVFINDGSHDATLLGVKALAARDPRVRYVDFSRNFGHQIAVSAGLDRARGQAVVIIDADLQDPPELIAEMYAKLQSGYEVVYAQRRKRHGETWFKRFTASMFYRLFNRFSNIQMPLDTGDFRIMARPVVDVLVSMPERHKFLRGQISWIGFRQTFVEYDRAPRAGGETGYTLRKMVRFALDGLTGFSTLPLKLATILGFVVSGLAFLLIVFVVIVKLFGTRLGFLVAPGWASQMIVSLFLGGVQLIAIGILGEYIARIADNTKQRPLYVVRESSDSISGGSATSGPLPMSSSTASTH